MESDDRMMQSQNVKKRGKKSQVQLSELPNNLQASQDDARRRKQHNTTTTLNNTTKTQTQKKQFLILTARGYEQPFNSANC